MSTLLFKFAVADDYTPLFKFAVQMTTVLLKFAVQMTTVLLKFAVADDYPTV